MPPFPIAVFADATSLPAFRMDVMAAWWPDWLRSPDWLRWPGAEWWTSLWESTQHGMIWTVTVVALVVGLVGTVLPMIPGPMLILAAAVWHVLAMRYWLHAPDPGLGWPGLVILVLFVVAAQIVETTSSAMGAKYFGSTKWGMVGAVLGGLIGLFWAPIGIFLGPIIGALAAEMAIAKRELKSAAKSTWGTVVGAVAGLFVKAGLGLAMVGYFFLDVFALAW